MINLPQIEEKILKFWKNKKIFEKSLKKNRKGKRFVFYEGPPFANGLPGIHHLLSRAFKDIILRYKTMEGFYVERKAGWDTHGLPTEMEAEKRLGIKTKKDIEKIGVRKFIETCRESVFTYKKEWEDFTERIGFWLDFKNAYITCDNDYIESLWWIIKQVWERGLLYKDYKVVPYCPRCGTSLSSHEVAQGYKTITEPSITVKFELIDEPGVYVLAWTTTPWTLPGNVALAINPKIDYIKFSLKNYPGISDGTYITSKKDFDNYKDQIKENKKRGGKVKIMEKIKGKELIGKKYKPLYKNKAPYQIIAGDFVSAEEGTGIVHIAPAFGEDDMEICKKNNFPILLTVNKEGKMLAEGYSWNNKFVKEADPLIIEYLKARDLIFHIENYEHEYPFCWRCNTPLLYYAKDSWFIKISEIKKDLIKNAEKINWIPDFIKEGRFGEWLKEIKDWNLSRERYWGTPLPVWLCQAGNLQKNSKFQIQNSKNCGNIRVIGSIQELEKLSGRKIKELHRPEIDEITFKCEKCGGEMKRVPEVIDCWFDSGSMPFAQWHYPFENKEKIDLSSRQKLDDKSRKKFFPADYIAEGIDQTRGWFYTLLAISTLLKKGAPYKNVACLGLVFDAQGQKMSKSKGNIVAPKEVIEKYGADCARFYFYTVNQIAEEKRFNFNEVKDLYRKFFDTLWQSYNFFSIYKDENFKPKSSFKPRNILDKWIISRLENINLEIIKKLDNFEIVSAARLFENFIDDLSNWYIRRSRRRFQAPENKKEKKEAENTLYYILEKISRLLAPFVPFIADEIYQKLEGKEESVHLAEYPKPNKKLIDNNLEKKMEEVRKIIMLALAERAKAKIKVRQPLNSLKILNFKSKIRNNKELLDLIKDEVNIKKVIFDKKIKSEVELDVELTKELREEGKFRELIRCIKIIRKDLNLTPKDRISVIATFSLSDIEKFKKEAGAVSFENKPEKEIKGEIKKEIKLDGKNYLIAVKRI